MNERWSPPTRYFWIALILICLAFVGWQVRELFRPLITAGLIAYIFYPLVEFVRRRFKLSQTVASRLVFFFSLALMIAIPASLVPLLAREMNTVVGDLIEMADDFEALLTKPVIIANLQFHFDNLIPAMRDSLSTIMQFLPENAFKWIATTSRGMLWSLVIVVSVYYFMTDWDRLRDWFISLAPPDYQHDLWRLYRKIKTVWMSYLRGQLTLMIIVAVVFSIVWSAVGLPGALLLGFLAGLFSLIPDVGPFAATALALIVALLEGSNFSWMPQNHIVFALIVAGLYIVLINVKNIWLRPLIYGRSVHMHEGVVFVAIIAAVIFTGIIGAFIIVPVLASLGVIGRYLHAKLIGLPAFEEDEPASPADLPAAAASPAASSPQPTPARKSARKPKSSQTRT